MLTLSEIPKLFKERLISLERNLPVPPAGLSPGQTARIYSLYLYLQSLAPRPVVDREEAKAKWHAARNFRLPGNNPALSGGPEAALNQYTESYELAANAMSRQGLPVSIGSDVFEDLTAYLASFRMSDGDLQRALGELLTIFESQT